MQPQAKHVDWAFISERCLPPDVKQCSGAESANLILGTSAQDSFKSFVTDAA